MTISSATETTSFELDCSHHTFIFRNDALEKKYPGGLDGFKNGYRSGSNDLITVHCEANTAMDTIRELEAIGLEQGEDFVVIDTDKCEILQMISSYEIEKPFWFEAGTDWLRYGHWKGRVLVWYDG